jgi:hypothetical protein
VTYRRLSEKVNLKILINFGLRQAGQAGIARPRKMPLGCWFHQTSYEIPAFISWYLANLNKSSSGIWPIFKLTLRGLKNTGKSL